MKTTLKMRPETRPEPAHDAAWSMAGLRYWLAASGFHGKPERIVPRIYSVPIQSRGSARSARRPLRMAKSRFLAADHKVAEA